MKANDSSSYAILCSSKDNLTLRWSMQNVSVNVKSEMTEIGRPTSVVCIYENQDKKKYPEQNAKLGWTGEISNVLTIFHFCLMSGGLQ
jgi:hypothetical protein